MMFFYYNLVANSKPKTCAIADRFCCKKGSKTFWFILFFPKYAITFIRKMRYDITELNGVKNIELQNVMQL